MANPTEQCGFCGATLHTARLLPAAVERLHELLSLDLAGGLRQRLSYPVGRAYRGEQYETWAQFQNMFHKALNGRRRIDGKA